MDHWQDLQGSWQAVWRAEDGRKATGTEVRDTRLTIAGERYVLCLGGYRVRGTVCGVDPGRRRGAIDFLADGPADGHRRTCLGIYVLTDDELTLCVAAPGGERPTSFAARPGSGHSLYLLRRSAAPATLPVGAA